MSKEKSQMHSRQKIRCLFVEDVEDDTLLLVMELKRSGYLIDYLRVDNEGALNDALHDDWDIVFSDYTLPTMNGMDALTIVRQANMEVPFIFVSATIGEAIAVEAMRNGAQDYIMKDNLMRFLPAVRRELVESETRKARREVEQKLRYLVNFDSLTGLRNRFSFVQKLQESFGNCQNAAIVHINMDRFKSINDSFGYEAGNIVLREIAVRLSKAIYSHGIVARLAADEFSLLFLDFTDTVGLFSFAEQLLKALEEDYFIRGVPVHLSASIGISAFPEHGRSASDLLAKADIATYRSKDDGGNAYTFYKESMSVQLEERLGLERNMRLGLDRKEFEVYYQPQWSFKKNAIVGMEALIRWHAKPNPVSPANFIPLAEETGFILPLTEWILRESFRNLRSIQNVYGNNIRLSVNISAKQFTDEKFPLFIADLLNEYSIEPACFELEITETAIIKDFKKALVTLSSLKSMGVAVALDDFGTGYSSLSYLKSFKPNFLKIDQSFIRELVENENSSAIVNAIIAMAEKLGIFTVAEGVETAEQLQLLEKMGCDLVQGYYIGRPVPLANFVEMLEKKH